MSKPKTILVIFGITGDLARRKLIPALCNIAEQGLFTDTQVIGISRREVNPAEFFVDMDLSGGAEVLLRHLSTFTMDLATADDYIRLKSHIDDISGKDTHIIFYLSVPPVATVPIAESIGKARMNTPSYKLLLEKPFGVDLTSAQESIDRISVYFDEHQLYRIDHYLAKEMTQNILAFRKQNAIFKHLWRNEFIESIDIVAAEKIGIEGRVGFYEQTGALRDFLQNHMMQLLALVIMELPADDKDIPAARLAALQNIRPIDLTRIIRGQYEGYEAEVENPGSTTETFVAVEVESQADRWAGVPIRLATGKNLAEQTTEIRIHFKRSSADESNLLVLHIQPKQAIELALWVKRPGFEKKYIEADMHFRYPDIPDRLAEAYERVLVDAFSSDKSLFTTADEVLQSWQLLQPVQEHWEMSESSLVKYTPQTPIDTLLESIS